MQATVPILKNLEKDLTSGWLSLALKTPIRNFKWRYLKKTGGCVVLFYQIEAEDIKIPQSLVLKCHDLDEKTRTLQADSLMYEREFSFYKNIAPTLSFNSPQVYALHQYDKEFFYIIMENLLENYEMAKFNRDGAISGESMKITLSEVKNLHIKFWEDRNLLDTYPFFEKEVLSDQLSRILTFKENWKIVRSQLPSLAGWRFQTANGFPEDMQELVNFLDYLAIDDNSLNFYHKANTILSQRPFTLLHGDLNCSNFFFQKQSDGDSAKKKVSFIDYGMTRSGPVALEFLTFWSTLSITDNQGLSSELINDYYQQLCEKLPEIEKTYPIETIKNDICIFMGVNMMAVVTMIGAGKLSRGAWMFWGTAWRRMIHHLWIPFQADSVLSAIITKI